MSNPLSPERVEAFRDNVYPEACLSEQDAQTGLALVQRVRELEVALGDLVEPVPCRGMQKLWALPPDVEARVLAQVGPAAPAGGAP